MFTVSAINELGEGEQGSVTGGLPKVNGLLITCYYCLSRTFLRSIIYRSDVLQFYSKIFCTFLMLNLNQELKSVSRYMTATFSHCTCLFSVPIPNLHFLLREKSMENIKQ